MNAGPARATYPAAKKRFLTGLPGNYRFAVSVRLYPKEKTLHRFEDVIVEVKTIRNGIVRGKIANNVQLLTNYHEGETISFPEVQVMNWLIIRPDGSEEGNYVGKFLDHYKP